MKINNLINFDRYFEEEENVGGDYWNFANLNEDELKEFIEEEKERNGSCYFLGKIIEQIKNPELKKKMTENYGKIIWITENIHDLTNIEGVFSEDELKKFVDTFLESLIKKQYQRIDTLKTLQNINIQDIEWLIERYDQIFNSTGKRESDDVQVSNANFLLSIQNKEIVEELTKRHKDQLPKEYFKYLEIQKDTRYVAKKAKKYQDETIGIDPKIKMGLEVEANNDMAIYFKCGSQEGLEDYSIDQDPTVSPRTGNSVSNYF